MSKRLKLVSVRLKPDREVYKNATFATATDVAFLMAKEIAEFDNETIGVLNLNAKGNLLSMNVVTLNAFEKKYGRYLCCKHLIECWKYDPDQ